MPPSPERADRTARLAPAPTSLIETALSPPGAAGLVAALALAMLWWSWARWPDVLVDFGRELYVPWRLATGEEALYRDIAYFNGPLSAYWNALWFRLFGASLRVLAVVNVALVAITVALLHALLARIGSRTAALLGCVTFVLVFAFGQQLPIGNYNFITPYSHEITHGVLLGLAAVLFVGRFARQGQRRDAAACGLCVGLAALTKPETLLATAGAATFGIALASWTRWHAPERPRDVAPILIYATAALLPMAISTLLLSRVEPLREALLDSLGGLRWLVSASPGSLRFYRATAGLLDPLASLRQMLAWSAAYGALLGGALLLGSVAARVRAPRIGSPTVPLGPSVAFAIVLAGLLAFAGSIPWGQALLPLPLALIVATVAFTLTALRERSGAEERARRVLAATLSLFSLLLLAKIALRARAAHYGFALAMPGTLLMIALAWDWLPRSIEPRAPRDGGTPGMHGAAAWVRAVLLALLVVFAGVHLARTASFFATRTARVGTGGDAIRADARGRQVGAMLAEIEARVPADASLVVLPEGIMVNYLARRRSSSRHLSFMPLEELLFGEDDMLRSLQESPPDFVLLVDRPLHEFGSAPFGAGYLDRVAGWIGTHYRPAGRPRAGEGMVLLRSIRSRAPRR